MIARVFELCRQKWRIDLHVFLGKRSLWSPFCSHLLASIFKIHVMLAVKKLEDSAVWLCI